MKFIRSCAGILFNVFVFSANFDRQGRVKTRQVLRKLDKTHTDLSDAMAEKEQLMKTVRRGAATLEAVQKEGLGWQGKFTDQQDKMKDGEKLLTCLKRSVVEKQRQIAALQRKSEDLAHKLLERDEEISTHAALCSEVCLFPFLYCFFLLTCSSLCYSKQIDKSKARRKKQ